MEGFQDDENLKKDTNPVEGSDLGEEKLDKASVEKLDEDIERLLEFLDGYGELWDGLGVKLQEQWYDAEMEARVGKDRQVAKDHLEGFIGILEKIKKEKNI